MLVRLAGAYTFLNGNVAVLVPVTACDPSHSAGESLAKPRLRRDGKKGPSYTRAV